MPRRILDAHVHPWPPRAYAAVLRWFDTHGWSIADRVDGDGIEAFLTHRGVMRYLAMTYAHKPGMAAGLNHWMADHARAHPRAIPMAAVHADDDVRAVLHEALDTLGLAGVKLHCHVMGVAPDDRRLWPVYEALCERRRVLVIHAGTAPASAAYPRPCESVSGMARLEPVLSAFPDLRCILPHLGADEVDAAAALLERYPNLYLDTAMMLARYFPRSPDRALLQRFHKRILFGTDFPILPYDYGRELAGLMALELDPGPLDAILWENAARLFDVSEPRSPGPENRQRQGMRWLVLLKASALAPGQCTNVFIGTMGIAIANIGGQFFAADNRCPHDGGPLGMGEMDQEWIICPYHGWAYSMKTGEFDNDRTRCMTTLRVKVDGDEVLVEVPEEGCTLPEPDYMARRHDHGR